MLSMLAVLIAAWIAVKIVIGLVISLVVAIGDGIEWWAERRRWRSRRTDL